MTLSSNRWASLDLIVTPGHIHHADDEPDQDDDGTDWRCEKGVPRQDAEGTRSLIEGIVYEN